jgi:hypothetical protein
VIGPPLAAGLRACAAGIYPAEAAAELLIATPRPCRHDFRGRFIRTGTSITDGTTPTAVTGWAAAIAALSAGQLPCCAERRLHRLAASLGEGIPVDLQDALTSLDDVRLELVTTAIRHAAGGARRPGIGQLRRIIRVISVSAEKAGLLGSQAGKPGLGIPGVRRARGEETLLAVAPSAPPQQRARDASPPSRCSAG